MSEQQTMTADEPQHDEQAQPKRGPGRPRKAAAAGWEPVAQEQEDRMPSPVPAATASAPATEDEESAPEPFLDPPGFACIGLPVQYVDHSGNLMPGILQSQPRTDKTTWNVRIFPEAMMAASVRGGVRYSPTPRVGCWSPLPNQP